MVKMKVREESLKYGISKKKKLERKGEEIEQEIATLEKRLPELNDDENKCGRTLRRRNANWRQ